MSAQRPKFNMSYNPAYQIDWTSAASGKWISRTKRCIKFRFGFSDAKAIRNGECGSNCRGEEHEVIFVWSIASGKRHVEYDGNEIHFSKTENIAGRFEMSWTIEGGHMIKLVAHAGTPISPPPGFRQFDLLLDGCSFFDLPRIFQVGTGQKNGKDTKAWDGSITRTSKNTCQISNSLSYDEHSSVESWSDISLGSVNASQIEKQKSANSLSTLKDPSNRKNQVLKMNDYHSRGATITLDFLS